MLAKQKGDKRHNARRPYISLYQKAALEHPNLHLERKPTTRDWAIKE